MWRSSLLQTMVGTAIRSVGFTETYRKIVRGLTPGKRVQADAYSSASPLLEDVGRLEPLLTPGGGGTGHFDDQLEADAVTEWLEKQDLEVRATPGGTFDELFDRLDGRPVAATALRLQSQEEQAIEEQFYAACEGDASRPLRPATDRRAAAQAVARVSSSAIKPPAEPDSPLTSSVDRVLSNLDGMHDAFVRLQEQLAGMEHWCERLIDPKPERRQRSRRMVDLART